MATKTERLAELYERCTDTVDSYSERDTMLDKLEDYYFVELTDEEQNPAEGIEVVKLPLGTNVIDLIQDLVANAEYTISVPALGTKPTHRANADSTEKFLHAVLDQSGRAQRQDLTGRAAWIGSMRGAVAGRVQVVDGWFSRDEKNKREIGRKLPILVQLRDPRSMYPEFGLDGLTYVVEKSTRAVRDVRKSYGEKMLEGKEPSEEVEWIEYWDDKVFCYWAGGQPCRRAGKGGMGPWPHLYGGMPYVYEFTRQTGRLEPEKRARPFLEAMTEVIDRLNMLMSQDATFAAQTIGTAWMVISETIGQENGPDLDLGNGAMNYLQPGEDIRPIQAGRKPPEIAELQMKLDAVLERGTFPGSLYGEDPGRVMAGYAINLLNQSGQVKLNPIVTAIERLIASLCENVLMVAEHYVSRMVDGPIPFYWVDDLEGEDGDTVRGQKEHKFDADNLKGIYRVEVNIGDLMPADEAANMQLAQQARAPGVHGLPLLSDETIADKYLKVRSPADERERIAREMARNDPEVLALERAVLVAEAKKELIETLTDLDVDVESVLAQVEAGMNPQQNQLEMPAQLPPELMPQAGPGGPMNPAAMGQQQMMQPPVSPVDEMGMPPMIPEMV